jgi:acyl carrier protein
MEPQEPKDSIRQFVAGTLIRKPGAEIKDGDDWLANGLVDSVGIMRLVSFVEREFDTSIPEDEITVDNFRSLKDVAHYLERRKTTRGRKPADPAAGDQGAETPR